VNELRTTWFSADDLVWFSILLINSIQLYSWQVSGKQTPYTKNHGPDDATQGQCQETPDTNCRKQFTAEEKEIDLINCFPNLLFNDYC
jgi:hypothetical protein